MIIYIAFFIGMLCEFLVSFSGALIGGYNEPLIIVAGMGLFYLTSLLAYDYKSVFTKKSIIELIVYVVIVSYHLLRGLPSTFPLIIHRNIKNRRRREP